MKIFVLFRDTRPLGVWLDEKEAFEAWRAYPEDDETEVTLEEWPANEIATKFKLMVRAIK